MSLTNDRLLQILELYNNEFKPRIRSIDSKYSLSYQEPQLDLPPTLNLQKLTYVEKSQGWIEQVAGQNVAEKFSAESRKLTDKYQMDKLNCQNKKVLLGEQLRQKLSKLLDEYNATLSALYRRLVNNGLIFSSAVTKANNDALATYNTQVQSANTNYQQAFSTVDDKEKLLDERYEQNQATMQEEHNMRLQEEIYKVQQKEYKEKERIARYNTALDEKETKYQASIKRSMEYARQAENDRALAAAKLYAEIGESGVQAQMLSEKYHYSKVYFGGWKREEALTVIQSDSFLVGHLGSYYDTFVDWVQTTLPV